MAPVVVLTAVVPWAGAVATIMVAGANPTGLLSDASTLIATGVAAPVLVTTGLKTSAPPVGAVTATVTAPAATPANTGYLDPATLAQALVAGYNRVPPLSDHAISGTCVVNQTTDSATCTLTTNRGRVVEPVGIAGDGSTYQAGPGMG